MNFARIILTAAALAGAVGTPAYAVTITTTFTPGSSVLPAFLPTPGDYVQNFTTTNRNGTTYVPDVLMGESITGVVRTFRGSVTGQAQAPNVTPSTGSFLAIGQGRATEPQFAGSFTVNLVNPAQLFSFVIGSLDAFNSVTLFFANSASQTFTGAQILSGSTAGGIATAGQSGRVTYDFGGTDFLTSIVFASSRGAFEIDSLASAAPEPAAWALMILGFGIVGSALRRRRRTQVRFNFA